MGGEIPVSYPASKISNLRHLVIKIKTNQMTHTKGTHDLKSLHNIKKL